MKLKQKFTVSNLIMLITSIVLVGVISVCFLIVFIMKYPVEDMHITRAALLNPLVLNKAIGDFFQKNPETILYVLAWALLCICVFAVTVTLFTHRLAMSIQKTIDELTSAADNIRNGDLSFQVMGSSCDEIDVLCQSFDSMRRTLKSAADKEKYMKEERSMLLANLSHDLKTPVTSIKGYIEGIRDGIADTPEKQKRYLDTIYSKAGMIDDMVNNLSIFSKLEMSKLNFEFTTGNINLFLRDFAEDFRLDIEKNDMRLALDIENTPATVKIDYEKIGRVFANLINNAVKYKKPGRGELKISSHIEDGGVYITVADDGMGIDNRELKNVFESFYRVDSARNLNIKGSGLGLGIAKQIVEKHGGKIWLKSEGVNKGTTAVIYLPLTVRKGLNV